MPTPEPRSSPPSQRDVPANLDLLIRKALKGGDTRQLESALADSVGEAPPTKRAPDRAATDPNKPGAGEVIVPGGSRGSAGSPAEAPTFAVPVELQDEEVDPPTEELEPPTDTAPAAPAASDEQAVDPEAAVLALWDQADRALSRLREGDLQSAHEALDEVIAAATAARAALPDRDSWSVQLPNYTRPYGLIIEGLGGPDSAPALADALHLDLATARLNAVSHWSRTALRDDDRESLERLAARANAGGIRAVVADRETLLKVPTALWVVGRMSDGRWYVCRQTPERADADAARAAGQLSVSSDDFTLAVPGDIVIRRYKERGGGRWSRGDASLSEMPERRVSVLDLYGSGPPLRLVVGVTDFEGLPGHEPSSATRSLKNLVDRLAEVWPGIRVEGRRVCAPFKAGRLAEGEQRAEVSGWPLWEEHSRSCWLLYSGG